MKVKYKDTGTTVNNNSNCYCCSCLYCYHNCNRCLHNGVV
jgi:hypothetical protein